MGPPLGPGSVILKPLKSLSDVKAGPARHQRAATGNGDGYNPTALMPPACPVRRRMQMTPPCAFIAAAGAWAPPTRSPKSCGRERIPHQTFILKRACLALMSKQVAGSGTILHLSASLACRTLTASQHGASCVRIGSEVRAFGRWHLMM